MSQPNPSTALARVVVDEMARNGVGYAVISPGSRSGALAIAASQHPRMKTEVVADERSAAFHALGRAKASGSPVAAICTSGTAPANYLPAIVEADMALTPLIAVSADRPEELRGVGANQTIDQVGLYGSKVRQAVDIPAPTGSEDRNDEWRTTVAGVVAAAVGWGSPPGPVHLNVAFREPTVPVPDDGRTRAERYPFEIEGRADGSPWVERGARDFPATDFEAPAGRRGLVIAGEGLYDISAVAELARHLGWPLLATAMSGGRPGGLTGYHHLLAEGVAGHLRPDVVVAIGAIGPSPRLEDLVASAGHRLRVDPMGRPFDPRRNATAILHADPVAVLGRFDRRGADGELAESWLAADIELGKRIEDYLGGDGEMSGPVIARVVDDSGWETLVAGSSLPIRDVDAHLTRSGPVLANRGASGIDGLVSTALGAASTGRSTLALAGDLSLLHDGNGFMCETHPDVVFVVVDNGGGGLFDLLPQATHAPGFERLFVTPHGRRFDRLAEFHGLGHADAASPEALSGEIRKRLTGGAHLVTVEVDRGHDVEVRRALDRIGAEVARSVEP